MIGRVAQVALLFSLELFQEVLSLNFWHSWHRADRPTQDTIPASLNLV